MRQLPSFRQVFPHRRPGIGITYSYVGKGDLRLREEWIFSTSTYQFLGARRLTLTSRHAA
jgi:hypothetical protein